MSNAANELCLILVNAEGQFCLWPADDRIPRGWAVERGPIPAEHGRAEVRALWTDLRPRSIAHTIVHRGPRPSRRRFNVDQPGPPFDSPPFD